MTLQRGRSGFLWGRLPLPATQLHMAGPAVVRPATSFASGLASDHDRYSYPGERPHGSFVVLGDDVFPLRWDRGEWLVTTRDGSVSPLSTWLGRHGQPSLDQRAAILAYGSNVNPGQIGGFSGGRAVIVLHASTVGLAATFCSTTRWDGQHPAGVMAVDAERVEVHGLLLVDDDQVAALDRKEGHGARYRRVVASGQRHSVAVVLEDGRAIIDEIVVYVQLAERPLALVGGAPAHLTEWTQEDFASAERTETQDHGLAIASSGARRPLAARALPVFVYGTLRPGESRWPLIRDVVESVEEATLLGRVVDTGRGYPALLLDGSGTVPGVLVHLAPEADIRALTVMDEIEAHPTLYVRALVRLSDGRLAWTYVWNDGGTM